MSKSYTQKVKNEIFEYARPSNQIEKGVLIPPNKHIVRREDDKVYGIVFGDGGSASLRLGVNSEWKEESSDFTVIVVASAPLGVVILQSGDISIEGVGGRKTYIIEGQDSSVLGETFDIFPNQDETQGECHFALLKYYNETSITFETSAEEIEEEDIPLKTVMDELNAFMKAEWN